MMTFYIKRDKQNRYRWRLKSRNKYWMARSEQSYSREAHCRRAISSIIQGLSGQITLYGSDGSEWIWQWDRSKLVCNVKKA